MDLSSQNAFKGVCHHYGPIGHKKAKCHVNLASAQHKQYLNGQNFSTIMDFSKETAWELHKKTYSTVTSAKQHFKCTNNQAIILLLL